MIRFRQWKFITYSGFDGSDILYDLEHDLQERKNVIDQYPAIAAVLRQKAREYKSYDEIMIHERWVMKQLRILRKCDFDDPEERWICPDIPVLKHPVRRKKPFEPTPWAVQMRKKLD